MKIFLSFVMILLSSNVYASEYVHKYNIQINENKTISNTDGFIDCVTDGDGVGGICWVYSGYSRVIEGTYREVLQQSKPGTIYRGFVIGEEYKGNVNQKVVHIYYSAQ